MTVWATMTRSWSRCLGSTRTIFGLPLRPTWIKFRKNYNFCKQSRRSRTRSWRRIRASWTSKKLSNGTRRSSRSCCKWRQIMIRRSRIWRISASTFKSVLTGRRIRWRPPKGRTRCSQWRWIRRKRTKIRWTNSGTKSKSKECKCKRQTWRCQTSSTLHSCLWSNNSTKWS